MPILRRDETPDPLGPHLLYLWERKLWILVPAMILFVLTYIAMRFVAEEFKVTAAVYVNRLSTGQDRDDVPNASTMAQLLESGMLLHKVRDEYMAAFGLDYAPEFEKFARRFKAKTDILQDTSVRKDISPVIELEVQSDGTSQTRFLMESWIRNFIRDYGNVAASEAVVKRDNLQHEDELLEKDLQKLEGERSQLRTKLALQEKLLAQSMDILAPTEYQQRSVQADRTMSTDLDSHSIGDSTVQVSVNSQSKPPGLLSKLTDVRLQLAEAAGTSASEELQRKAAAITSVIAETETSVTELQKVVADLQREVSRLDREVENKRSIQARLRVSLNKFFTAAALASDTLQNGMPAGGDVRAISMPVLPEQRIWPKRTFVAGGVALVAMLFISIALLLHRYLQTLAIRNAASVE